MSEYSPSEWQSSDGQESNSDYMVIQGQNDLISLNQAQRIFIHEKKPNTNRNRHIYKKLMYRIEKYWEYKESYHEYTDSQIVQLLDQRYGTSIQYEDIFPVRRISINPDAQAHLGTIDISTVEADKLFVYDPNVTAARRPTQQQLDFFTIILKSETSKVQLNTGSSNTYLITKYIFNSIPMFQVMAWEDNVSYRYYFFYLPIHNNPLLSTPLLSIAQNPQHLDLYLFYNSNGVLIQKLSTDLL